MDNALWLQLHHKLGLILHL